MKNKKEQPSRRGFLTGMLTGLGAATVVVAAGAGKSKASEGSNADSSNSETLYHRSAETERYFKTL